MRVTPIPIQATWPIYNKRRRNVLAEEDALLCRFVTFGLASKGGAVAGGDFLMGYLMDVNESVPKSFITSSGFSTLERVAQQKFNERVVDPCGGVELFEARGRPQR